MNTDFILEGKKDKKILYIENVASIDSTNFYQAAALAAYECNLEFHIAYNAMDRTEKKVNEIYKKYGAIFHQIDFYRNPYDLRNIKAYQQCVNLIKQENIDIIHCNTPIGGVIGRLAGKKCKVPTIIYQAHGFHFFKGAPKLNWMLYYPIEKWLAHKTDVLITITKEDYNLAKKFRLRGDGKVYYVPGVGIDTDKYITGQQLRQKKRSQMGLKDNEIALISIGNLIQRKDYFLAIKAVACANNSKLQYFICGQGADEKKLKKYVLELGVENNVHFLGYRTDIKELLNAMDLFLFTTKQEGLSRSLIEAMASGLPCIVSNVCGNNDLLKNEIGGFFCDDLDEFVNAIKRLAVNEHLRNRMGINNLKAIQAFKKENVTDKIRELMLSGGTEIYELMPIRARKRFEIGIPLEATLLISVGDLNINKNNEVIINALQKLKENNIHYVLCGEGDRLDKLIQLSKPIKERVHFLGYRTDVKELLEMSDIFVLPSLREGLSRSLMEAMASGLPCIVSNIRGNIDLITEDKGGIFVDACDIDGWKDAIQSLSFDKAKQIEYGNHNRFVIKNFSLETVVKMTKDIYRKVITSEYYV